VLYRSFRNTVPCAALVEKNYIMFFRVKTVFVLVGQTSSRPTVQEDNRRAFVISPLLYIYCVMSVCGFPSVFSDGVFISSKIFLDHSYE
jgi:hypothetical protein